MKAVFRRSARSEQMRFVVLSLVLFASSWILLDVHWTVALVLAGGVAGAFVLGRVLHHSWLSSIAVDGTGLVCRYRGARLSMAWDDVIRIEPAVTRVPVRGAEAVVRHAVITDSAGRSVAFADLSLVGSRPVFADGVPVHDIGEPEILLAIAARMTGDERFLPAPAPPDAEPVAASVKEPARRVDVAGLGALVLKLGGKVGKALGGLLKTVKPGLAVASGAVYALIFDWRFALGLMVMLLVHEYGHVHAMRRSGLPVRGIYFIPLLGAAAVTDGTWRTRGQQAYIALNGPLWGLILTLPLLAAGLAVGERMPLLPAMAAWWSLINLFNLLPINPLDGGRVLNAVSHSLSSRLGIAVSGAAFVAGLALAFAFQVWLFVVVGIFGLIEFISELAASASMSRLRMARLADTVPAEALLRLRLLARPVFRSEDEVRLQGLELARLRRTLALARIEPMPRSRTIVWGLLYLALAAAFIGVIAVTASNPAAGLALEVLR